MASIPDLLNLLFSTFPPVGSGDPQAQLAAYAMSIEGRDVRDIEAAVRAIISGTAPGMNPNFAPSAGALGAEVVRQQNLRADSEARSRKPALPPPPVEKSPESQARVKAKVDALLQRMADQARTADAAAEQRRKNAWQRTNDYFDKRRGYSIGDPDSEEAAG